MNYFFNIGALASKWIADGGIIMKCRKISHLTFILILCYLLSFLSSCILGISVVRHLATLHRSLVNSLFFSCLISTSDIN